MGGGSSKRAQTGPLDSVTPSQSGQIGSSDPSQPPRNARERLAKAEEQLTEEKQKLERLKKEGEQAQQAWKSAADQEEQLQSDLSRCRTTSGALRQPLQQEIERKEQSTSACDVANQELADLEAEISVQTAGAAAAQARIDRTKEKRAAFKQARDDLLAERGPPPTLQLAREATGGARRALEKTEEEVAAHLAELEQLKAEAEDWQQKRSVDLDTLIGLQTEHTSLREQVQALDQALTIVEEENRALQERVFAARDEVLKVEVATEHMGHEVERMTVEAHEKGIQLETLGSMYQHEVDPVKDVLVDTTSRKREADTLHAQRVAEIESSAKSHVDSLNVNNAVQMRPAAVVGLTGQLVLGSVQ